MNEDTDKPDTPEKVLADMRALADDIEAGRAIVGQTVWRSFASRFEAALKRDRAKIEAAALEAGGMVEASRHKPDNAAMRKALRNCARYICCAEAGVVTMNDGDVELDPDELVKEACAALASPTTEREAK